MGASLRYAGRRTWADLGGWATWFGVVVIPIAIFAYQKRDKTIPENWSALQDLNVATFFAYAVAVVGVFVIHLICAPYQLEKAAHSKTRERLAAVDLELAKVSGSQPRVIDATLATEVMRVIAEKADRLGIKRNHAEHAGSDEAAVLAARLSEVVQMAGLGSYPHSELYGGRDPRSRGVIVYQRGGDAYAAFASERAGALTAGGITAQVRDREGDGEPWISFYVARNPQA